NLSEFTPEEGQTYIRKQLPEASVEDMNALLEVVAYLPLALSHAVAYIVEGECTLAEYPRRFALHQLSLGGNIAQGRRIQPAESTILTTFLLTLIPLQRQSPAAEAILTACAYLAPENIPCSVVKAGFVEQAVQAPEVFQQRGTTLRDCGLLQNDEK